MSEETKMLKKRPKTDIKGQRFGRLTAIEFLYFDDKHRDCWKFQCDCGQEKVMPAANVKWNRVRSCGCLSKEQAGELKKKHIAGERFGRLVAVCPTKDRDKVHKSVIWECKCDCGNTVYYAVSQLKKGGTLSCGCLYKDTRSQIAEKRQDAVEGTYLSALTSTKKLRANNTTGCTGIYHIKKLDRWSAEIVFKKKRYFLGSYKDKDQAVAARKEAERLLHDPFIEEQWEHMTENARKKYLAYRGEKISEKPAKNTSKFVERSVNTKLK